MDFTNCADLVKLLGQRMAAVAAPGWQQGDSLIDAFGRGQRPVPPGMPLLSARFAPATATLGLRPPRGNWPVRGRWLGRVGRVLLPSGQLTLQFGNLFVPLGNLLFTLDHLFAELLVLLQETLVLALQFLPRAPRLISTRRPRRPAKI
jgi:hypothetical protein